MSSTVPMPDYEMQLRVRYAECDMQVTGPRELVNGEQESFVGRYPWRRSRLARGRAELGVGGGAT